MMLSAQRLRVANMLGGLAVAIGDRIAAGSREAALVALDSHPGGTVRHLSRALGRSHSATVRLLDGLERDRLVRRRPGDDARTIRLELTARGRAAAAQVRAARTRTLDGLVDALPDREVARLEPLIERLLAASAVDADSRWRTCRLCEEPRCETGNTCPVDAAAPR
jgi:MarR family transcriptional regulator, negative regulator of the multidrug operon emrRAB